MCIYTCTYPYFLVVNTPYPSSIVIGSSQNKLSLWRKCKILLLRDVSERKKGGMGREREREREREVGWHTYMIVKLDRHDAGSAPMESALGLHFPCKIKKNQIHDTHTHTHTSYWTSFFAYLVYFSSSRPWHVCRHPRRLGSDHQHWMPLHTPHYHEHPNVQKWNHSH